MGAHVASQDDAKSPGSDGASPYQGRGLPHCLATAISAVDLVDQSPRSLWGWATSQARMTRKAPVRTEPHPTRAGSSVPRHGDICCRLGRPIAQEFMGAHVASQDDAKSPGSDGASPYQRGFSRIASRRRYLLSTWSTNHSGVHGGSCPKPG
jgi:hypothetical protein